MLVSEGIDRSLNSFFYPAGVNRPKVDTLSGSMTNSQTSVPLTGYQTYSPQTILQIGTELLLSLEAEPTSTISPVIRGYLDTDAATHSAGDIVEFDPEYPRYTIFDAMVSTIRTLRGKGLYRLVAETQLTADLVSPLTTDAGTLDVFSIHAYDGVTWRPLEEHRDYEVFTAWDPPKIQILNAPFSGATLLINYKTDFTVPTTEADDLTTISGVPAPLADYLPMAAAGQLLMGKEFAALGRQAKHEFKTGDVPPGTALSVGERLLRHFDEQIELAKRVQRQRTPTGVAVSR